jgi:hypothetical protein
VVLDTVKPLVEAWDCLVLGLAGLGQDVVGDSARLRLGCFCYDQKAYILGWARRGARTGALGRDGARVGVL